MTLEIQQLLSDTKAAFDKSPIKRFAEENRLNWFYSISSTRLILNNNLIVGFNGGAIDNYNYQPQTQIPTDNFKALFDNKDLGSLQRIYEPLKQYFPDGDIDNCVQTNFCFFRSKTEGQITRVDLELSTPLFQKFISIIKPKRIIGFSSKLRDYFLHSSFCKNLEQLNIPSNRKTLYVVKGVYINNNEVIPVYFLPHPNSKFTTGARQTAWEFCFRPGNTKIGDAENRQKRVS